MGGVVTVVVTVVVIMTLNHFVMRGAGKHL